MKNSYFKAKILSALLLLTLFINYSNAQTATGLNFDGTNDQVTITDNAAYNLGTGNFTVEAWVKAFNPQTNSSPSIFYRKSGSAGLSIWLNSSGQLSFTIGSSYAQYGNADLDDNICHHIAIVRTAVSAVSVYVDGVFKGTSTITFGSISTTVSLTIGYGGAFKGWIHEARFWNVARTQTQIQASKNIFLAGNEAGLIGYWRMNEGSGQTINDLSVTNNDGFLGTVSTIDAADPVFISNSCMCPNPVITSTGGAVCTGQNPTLTTSLIAGYSYQWKLNGANISGATSSTYVATAAGTYSCVATAFGCSGTSNAINLISGAPPATISPGGPTTFCSGGNVLLSANTGTLLSYQWKLNGANIPGATALNRSVTASGSYTCVVTNNCGSSTSNNITVTVNQTPTASISAGGPVTFCQPGSVLLTANSGAGYAYQWKLNNTNIGGATSQTYSAAAAGNYTTVVTSGSCTATSNSITITVHQPLTPIITNQGFGGFCPSSTVGLQTVYVTGATYQWLEDTYPIPSTNGYQLVVGHNGNYSVNVTNACGTYQAAPYTVTDFISPWFDPYITIGYTGSLNICNGGSVYLYINNNTFYYSPTYQWYKDGIAISGATGTAYTATTAGNYACAVSDYLIWCGQGPNVFSNWLTATTGTGTPPIVTISAGGATTFCNSGNVTLNSTVNTSVTYQWKKNNVNISGATTASYIANSTGSYTCAVTNSCGSSTSNVIIVTVQTLTVSITSPTTNICTGSSVTLTATAQTGNAYQWKLNGSNIGGATNSTYASTASGSYTCMITNLCGSTTSNTIIMTLRPLPTATISGTQTICSGSLATITINFTGTANWWGYYYNGSSYFNFNTSNNPYTTNVFPTANTTYTLYSSFHDLYCNGSVGGSAVVTVQSLPSATITPSGSTTFCANGSVLLNANTGIGLNYQWKKNGTNISGATSSGCTATSSGSYIVQITNSCGSSTSSPVVVTVNPNPSATITPAGPTTFCQGGNVVLNGPVNINYTYVWKKNGVNISGGTSSSYTASTSGTYTVRVTNTATGCSKVTNPGIVVTKNPLPTATITPGGTITFCAGQSALLTANSGTGYTYKWKKNGSYISGATAMTYTVTTAGNYRVEVTNSYGCTKTSSADTVVVPCKEGENIFAENNFDVTVYPNPSSGDFTFEIINTKDEAISIEVFDMIGKLVLNETFNDLKFEIRNSQLVPGIYSAAVTVGETKKTLKIVKTK